MLPLCGLIAVAWLSSCQAALHIVESGCDPVCKALSSYYESHVEHMMNHSMKTVHEEAVSQSQIEEYPIFIFDQRAASSLKVQGHLSASVAGWLDGIELQQQEPLKTKTTYDILGEQSLLLPVTTLRLWHRGDLNDAQVTKRLKKQKVAKTQVIFDPAHAKELNNHCAYSCMSYVCWDSSMFWAAKPMRKSIQHAWLEPAQSRMLSWIAAQEGLSEL